MNRKHWIRDKLCPFSTWDTALANFRIHRIIESTLSSTNLNLWNLIPVLYYPRFTAPPDSVSINVFRVFITGLLSSAEGNTTTMWTGATTDLWFPSSQNHSAILYSACQLPLPLPTAAFQILAPVPRALPNSFIASGFYLRTSLASKNN